MQKKHYNNSSIGLTIFTKNEENTIGTVIEKACRHVERKDIFVIDGHSIDDTATVVSRKGVGLLLDSKQGKGSAVKLAIENVQRDILIFMDSDGSHNPEDIPLLLAPILNNKNIDMVIGSRIKGGSDEFHNSFHELMRFAGNVTGTFLVNLIWRTNLSDIQNGFRVVRKQAMREICLEENSFAIEQEMVMKCLKNKKKIVEVPVWESRREYNHSHIIASQMLPKYIKSFMKNIF